MEDKVRQFLNGHSADAIIKEENFRGEQQFTVRAEAVYGLCEALFQDNQLDVRLLADITCVDWMGHDEAEAGRFELVYNLYSLSHKYRFFLKVRLPENEPTIKSLVPLRPAADWLEREVWDLFGITFEGHPNLTKILTADELEGHPLRKDFPLTYEEPVFSWNKDNPPEVIK